MRCSKSLWNNQQWRKPLARVHPWSWNIKAKPFILYRYFKISFTSFIILYLSINTNHEELNQTLTLIRLDFFRKVEPILIIQSALSRGESAATLFVSHRIAIFFMDDGKAKSIAHRRTFSARSPPTHKFNAFVGAKYSFHTFGYLLRPATMESPSRGLESLIITQWLR